MNNILAAVIHASLLIGAYLFFAYGTDRAFQRVKDVAHIIAKACN
jgi:hypothetical protein